MIPQSIKDKIEVEYPDNHYTGVTNEEMGNLRKAAEHGYELAMEQNKSLMDEINELKMANMTHEYNNAEAERFFPELKRQIEEPLLDENKELKEENEKLKKEIDGLAKDYPYYPMGMK